MVLKASDKGGMHEAHQKILAGCEAIVQKGQRSHFIPKITIEFLDGKKKEYLHHEQRPNAQSALAVAKLRLHGSRLAGRIIN